MATYIEISKTAKVYSTYKPGDNVFCVTVKELVACGVLESSILSGLKRQKAGTVHCWPHHKTGKVVYIHFEGLKEIYKNIIKVVLLDNMEPGQWWETKQKGNIIKERLNVLLPEICPDEKEILNIMLPTGEHLPKAEQEKLRAASRWVNFLADNESKADILRIGYKSKTVFYQDVIYCLKNKGVKLPYSYPKLKEKIREYKKEGLRVLIDNRLCANENAAKVKSPDQHAILIKLLAHHNGLDAAQVAAPYNEIAKLKGWPEISRRTVLEYKKKYKLIIEAAREGKKAFRDNISMQVTRTRPSFPLAFWSLDGWKAELYFQKSIINKSGHNVQTYNNRLVIYIVLDAFNNYPIGYAIGDAENNDLAKAALKNAADHVAELMGGYFRPFQIQSDRAGIKTLGALFSGMAKHFTPAAVGNAKAKPVERYNRYLIDNYCQYYNNFAGFGIKSPKQPNIDVQNKIKGQFPNREQCINQLEFIIYKEREAKRAELLEAWNSLTDDKKLSLTREQYLYLLGQKNERTIRYNGRGIAPQIAGQLYNYDCFDINMRKDFLTSWTLYHDKNDLSTVLAVSPDEKQRYLLTEKYKQPMALADRKPGDVEALKEVMNFNKELETHVIKELGAADEIGRKVLESIQPKELTDRATAVLLTDSRGQHKEHLYNYFENQEETEVKIISSKPKRTRQKAAQQPTAENTGAYLSHARNKVDMNKYLNTNL